MKILILFLLLISNLFSCTLCKVDVPSLQVDIVATPKNKITTFNITWSFNKEFTNNLKIYDENKNYLFDKPELNNIKNVLEEYTKKINYMTNIKSIYKSLSFKNTKALQIEKLDSSSVHFNENNQLIYNYQFTIDLALIENNKLELIFIDKGRNFNFYINTIDLKGFIKKTINIKQAKAYIHLYEGAIENGKIKEKIKIQNDESFYSFLETKLKELKEKLHTLLNEIKETHSLSAYGWLLLFSFGYGVLHAIGPGHGKSLVSAYFLGNNRSVTKTFYISTLIGVVHTFSAFIITFVIYYSLNTFLSSQLTDIESIAIKISAVIIIAIALYLIYKKLKERKAKKLATWSAHKPSCACSGCNTNSSDLGVILAAGIVPCPGTVTIFIFTLSLGLYYVGFLSALAMSAGMSLVIFVTAYLSKNIREKANKNETLIKVFEYGSLVFILTLGLFLLLVA